MQTWYGLRRVHTEHVAQCKRMNIHVTLLNVLNDHFTLVLGVRTLRKMMAALNRRRRLLLLLLLVRRRARRGQRRTRRTWVRKINSNRVNLGEFHSLIQEMRLSDHDSFFKYFRMSPSRFDHLLSLIGPKIQRQNTNLRSAISPAERLAVTLRFLATGDSMQTIAFSYRMGHSTVCTIIPEVCDAIWDALSITYLNCPSTAQEWKRISDSYSRLWNFPHCLRAIDGKHIVIQAPSRAGSIYYNYKGTHSIVLMAVCDSQYCFTMIDVGDYGRHSDGGVLSNSGFGQALESGRLLLPPPENIPGTNFDLPYVFVGDAAFPLRHNMMRPYPGRFLPEELQIFNYRLSRARRIIENTFGVMAAKFRIFRRPIIADPEKVTKITKAACCLHNYLKISDIRSSQSSRQYCPAGYIDHEDALGNFIPGDWRTEEGRSTGLTRIPRVGSNSYSQSAANIRNSYKEYFLTSEGELEWQYRHVRS